MSYSLGQSVNTALRNYKTNSERNIQTLAFSNFVTFMPNFQVNISNPITSYLYRCEIFDQLTVIIYSPFSVFLNRKLVNTLLDYLTFNKTNSNLFFKQQGLEEFL